MWGSPMEYNFASELGSWQGVLLVIYAAVALLWAFLARRLFAKIGALRTKVEDASSYYELILQAELYRERFRTLRFAFGDLMHRMSDAIAWPRLLL